MFFHPMHQRAPVDDCLEEITDKSHLNEPLGQSAVHMIHPILTFNAFRLSDNLLVDNIIIL